LPEQAAFFLQQSVEKLVRAVLEHEGLVAGKTHSIGAMSGLLPENHPWREAFDAMDRLSPSATRYRYPTSVGGVLKADRGQLSRDIRDVEHIARDVATWLSFRT
jgi:HEPN domain-containing protein